MLEADAGMQEYAVRRIHDILEDLQPVAGIGERVGDHPIVGQIECIVIGEFRLELRRPHIGEDE
jgi:hypothetical protein